MSEKNQGIIRKNDCPKARFPFYLQVLKCSILPPCEKFMASTNCFFSPSLKFYLSERLKLYVSAYKVIKLQFKQGSLVFNCTEINGEYSLPLA